jgi:4-hydroxythreonine-4-phosphate dehydrogenase
MIYVTQGHEHGIGLEIFLKSFLMLSSLDRKQVTLITQKKHLEEHFKWMNLSPMLFKDLNVLFAESTEAPASSITLLKAFEVLTDKDTLVTLPTSKDQLIYKKKSYAGYTELFRAFFNKPEIAMTFKGVDLDVVLVTDHIPLNKVAQIIDENLIVSKVKTTLEFFQKYFYNFEEVIFAGINPHVGENGILGNEDACISKAIAILKSNYAVNFKGPYSGDTLHIHHSTDKKQLFVYMFHDQGLPVFKSKFGFVGLNISMGLPFLRLSVDHGTAFELYGKNKGDMSGMLYLLKEALEVNQNVDKRNKGR